MSNISIGINQPARKNIVQQLRVLLASNYTLYIKTQNFHWNVTGPHFQTLHLMFEGHYNELALVNDEIAERIRALGERAPGSYSEFGGLTIIEENLEKISAESMVAALLSDHEKMAEKIREVIVLAGGSDDEATNDLLSPRLNAHEKTAWMLRAFLDK